MPEPIDHDRSRAGARSRSTSSTARAAISASPRARPACSRCRSTVNHMGYRYPELLPRVHRLRRVLLRLPRLRVRGVPLRRAGAHGGHGMTATAPARDRVLMEGSEALARAAIVAGCRFFAGYPMTPFTEVLEHFATAAPRRRRRVHQRRVGARSGRHDLGRALDRRARRDRLDRPGPLAHAGVVLGDHARRAAARRVQHGARPAGLLPGDTRRRARRLPPHRARAARRHRRRRARAARVPPRRQVAQSRRSSTATTSSRTRRRRSRSSRSSFPDAARQGLGRRRLALRQRRAAASVTPLGVGKVGQRALGQEGKAQYIATKLPADGARGARRDRASSTTPRR